MPEKDFILTFSIIAILFLFGCRETVGPVLDIENAWGRPSPNNAMAGALYMEIHNTGSEADTLVAAVSPACGVIEFHETLMKDDVMSMQPVPEGRIPVPAGETVTLTGGLHLMCIDKKIDFDAGVVIPLTLQFEITGEVILEVEVRNP